MSPAKISKRCGSVLVGITLVVLSLLFVKPSRAQTSNPVPLINQPLLPDATAPGGPQFTLTVNGTGFVSNSTVNWNGSPLATTFISGSQLTATVPAADIATASTGWVTVVNPAPGGGTSNTVFFTVTANVGSAVGFALGSSPPTGTEPTSVAVGDFNGDGKLDLAVANYCGNDPTCSAGTVSILLGDGAGNFTLASSPAAGAGPYAVAVGDFNGDGKLDLAVANNCFYCGSPGTVSILLGDGTGNFTLASSPTVGYRPESVVVGDFNEDGILDLAVANFCGNGGGICTSSGTVSILLGDGTGNFTLASYPAVGVGAESVAVGDFNGDGNLDLAVANNGTSTVSVLLGDGTGNFTLASSPETGLEPDSVAVGDFNGDGKLDLVVANHDCTGWFNYNLSVLLGDGTGNFTLASSPGTGTWGPPTSVAVGDFNGDGIVDLAVANDLNSVVILLGDGTGNFTLAASPYVAWYPDSIAVGDFNGDGMMDVAVALQSSGVSTLQQVPVPPAVTLSPANLSFGAQPVGTTSGPLTVTLTNTGGETLDITSITASTKFPQTNTCGTSLAPAASCTITVNFEPSGLGTVTGTITITDNASDSPQTVSLSGVGTVMSLSPTSLNFGTKAVGQTSAPQTVTLTNSDYRALTIFATHFVGSDSGDFAQTNTCGTSVPAGASCTFSITFTPQGKGIRVAKLAVLDNGGGGPQTVTLNGYGLTR